MFKEREKFSKLAKKNNRWSRIYTAGIGKWRFYSKHQQAMSVTKKKTWFWSLVNTRKYPLRGYILGVLTHTTAWTDTGEVMKH